MLGGYVGRILRVDLSSGKMKDDGLPSEKVLRSYLGCWGLGLRYLYDECPPGIAPWDPENPLMFLNGPLTGTHMPGANNLTCITLNFDTEITAGRAHTHGFFGPNLKFAGYDGIITTGRADKPVYLWIHDGEAEIREAGDIWGKDTHETEDIVKERVGEPKASVAAIGPAGENLCAGALIENDKNHSMAHSGVGAVMGSKKLKAIAAFGKNREIPLVDKQREAEAAKRWIDSLDYGPRSAPRIVGSEYKRHHRHEYEQSHVDRMGGVVAMNFRQWRLPGFVADAINKVTPRSCYRCPIGCCYDLEIVSGPHKGYVATLAGGGEPIEAAGSIVGLMASGDVFYMVDLFDRLGLEASTAGCTIAMAFEAYEKGLLTKEDTDGLELRWGDAEVMEKLVRKYAHREGFGNLLAKGPRAAAEIIGGDAPNFAVHIKGSGMSLHDWRHGWGILLSQIVGPGSGWPGMAADLLRAEPFAGFPEMTDHFNPRIKPMEVSRTNVVKHLDDSIGVCWFDTMGMPNIDKLLIDAFAAVTGWDMTSEELWQIGERIANLERAFNVRRGLRPKDDHDVSPRLLEPIDGGPDKGKTIAPYLRGMINEYYRLMGWDEKSGKPWRSTLKRLGLEDVAKDLWG